MLDLINERQAEITDLCRRHQVRRLELFGSAATGSFDPQTSDLDFLVDFEPLPPGQHSRAYFGLWFALEDLFGRRADLVESPAVTNPFFLRSIAATRRVLYAA